jgi:L-threonylcarbamoyladenylate synthase
VTSARPRTIGAAPGAAAAYAVGEARAAIAAGEIIAFPTETFYGLGADPAREDAVAAIFSAKGRPAGEALPLIAADVAAARALAARWSHTAQRLADAFWPGPLTLVVPVRAGAVVAGHPLARALAGAAPNGVLTATSANRSGSAALATARAVAEALGPGLALIIDGGPSPGGLASTIVDVAGEDPRLIREGPVPFDRVLEFVR